MPGETFVDQLDRWMIDVFGMDFSRHMPSVPAIPAQPESAPADATADLGGLSSKHESGNRGSNAVGNDSTGGWSYGKYQIASKTGTMKEFIDYVKDADPALYKTLEDAGGEKGATDHTDAFAKAWDDAATSGKLGPLEHGFIGKTHYTPVADKLKEEDGVDLSQRDKAVRDVTWSVAVQHGPVATTIIKRAVDKLVAAETAKDTKAGTTRTNQEIVDAISDKDLIDSIYDERGATTDDGKMKYFGKSTDAVQKAVADRFKTERTEAQKELADDQGAAAKPAAAPAPAP